MKDSPQISTEFKFRVWDISNKCWMKRILAPDSPVPSWVTTANNNDAMYDMPIDYLMESPQWWTVERWMGAQDKFKRDIYEGDIVFVYRPKNRFIVRFGKIQRNVVSHDSTKVWPLEFNTFYFEALDDHKPYQSIIKNTVGEHDLKGTSVIGNMHENPDML